MSGKSASILVKILGDDSKLRRTLDTTESRLSGFATKTQNVGKSLMKGGAVMTAGVTAPLAMLAKGAFDAFAEAEEAQAQLNASLQSTGATAWTSVGKIDALASSMQNKLGIDGDLIKSGASVLLTFTKVQNKAGEGNAIFDRATQTAADMAAKLGTDLPAANMLLGKALNDPLRGMGALRKAGVQLTAGQEEQVKAFVESGDVLSAQKILLGELETQFGGSAEAAGNTAKGGLEKLRLKFEDIQESIGERLVPILDKLGGWLEKLMEWWDKLGPKGQTIALVIAAIAAAIGPVVTVIGALVTAIGFIISPVGLVVAAIAGLIAAFIYFHKTNEGFRKWVDGTVDAVKVKLGQAFEFLTKTVLPALVAFWSGTLLPALQAAASWITGTLWPVIQTVARVIGETFVAAIRAVVEWVTGSLVPALQAFGGWLANTFGPIVVAVAGFWSGVLWPALKAVAGFIAGTLVPVIVTIVGWIAGKLVPVVQFVAGVFVNVLFPALAAVARFIVGTVIPVIAQIIATIINVATWVGRKIGEIVGFVISIPGRIARTVSSLWNGIRDGITSARDWIQQRIADVVGFVTALPGRIGRAAGGMWDGIKNAFRGAINWIIDKWNGLSFTLPSVEVFGQKIGGMTLSTPNIPRLHSGGYAGLRRNEVPAILEAGESVRSRRQEAAVQRALGDALALAGGAGSGGAAPVHLHFHGPVARDSVEWVLEQVEEAARRGLSVRQLKQRMAG